MSALREELLLRALLSCARTGEPSELDDVDTMLVALMAQRYQIGEGILYNVAPELPEEEEWLEETFGEILDDMRDITISPKGIAYVLKIHEMFQEGLDIEEIAKTLGLEDEESVQLIYTAGNETGALDAGLKVVELPEL